VGIRKAAAILTTVAAVIVQLRVIEGEGAIYSIGTRATRGLTVQVTDEAGNPVSGASVSFRLPDQGPSGAFSDGLRTAVVTTQNDGKASVWGMQWNKTPGPFEVRITAIKGQARAGLVSTQYLSDTVPKSGGTGTFQASHHWPYKWIAIGAVAAGAGAGLAFARGTQKPAAATAPPVQTSIGLPSIIISGPK
jgi:hypothetical protein